MNTELLAIVACPRCQGRLEYNQDKQQLICRFEHIAYPIKNGIPVLLAEQAIDLDKENHQTD